MSNRKFTGLSRNKVCTSSERLNNRTRKRGEESVNDENNLVAHSSKKVKRDYRVQDKMFLCPEENCGKRFGSQNNLTSHINRMHNADRKFPCDGCSTKFYTQEQMEKHRVIHTRERVHICTHPGCSKAFDLQKDLKRHWRVHTGERPWFCLVPNCDFTISRKDNLKRHIIHVHGKSDAAASKLASNGYMAKGPTNTVEPAPWEEEAQVESLDRVKEKVACRPLKRSKIEINAKKKSADKKKRRVVVKQGKRVPHTDELGEYVDKPYACNMCSGIFARLEDIKDHAEALHGLSLVDPDANIEQQYMDNEGKMEAIAGKGDDPPMPRSKPDMKLLKIEPPMSADNFDYFVNLSSPYNDEETDDETDNEFLDPGMDTSDEESSDEYDPNLPWMTETDEEQSTDEDEISSINDGDAYNSFDVFHDMPQISAEILPVQSEMNKDVSESGENNDCASNVFGESMIVWDIEPTDTDQMPTYILPHEVPSEDAISNESEQNDNSCPSYILLETNAISGSCEQGAVHVNIFYPGDGETVNPTNIDWSQLPTLHCNPGESSVTNDGQCEEVALPSTSLLCLNETLLSQEDQNQITTPPYLFNVHGKEFFLAANINISCVGLEVDENSDNDASWFHWYTNALRNFLTQYNLSGDMSELIAATRNNVSSPEEINGRRMCTGMGTILLKIAGNAKQLDMIRKEFETVYKNVESIQEPGLEHIATCRENAEFFKNFSDFEVTD